MDAALQVLLENAASDSVDEQSGALFQIAMLLEKSTRPSDEPEFYESMLPAELLRLQLNNSVQRELLRGVVKNADLRRVASPFIWALGKASPVVAIHFLVQFLEQHPEWLSSPETAYQAIITLDNCLDHDQKTEIAEDIRRSLHSDPITIFLKHALASTDPRLTEHATRVSRKIERLLFR